MWKSQIDLENYITKAGKERAVRTMEKNELNGKAELNPYANVFFKKFTLPLAQLLEEELNKKKPGQNYEAVAYLRILEPQVVSFITVRTVFSEIMKSESYEVNIRKLYSSVGDNIHGELILRSFNKASPEEYFMFKETLSKRFSMDVNYRINVAKRRMKLSEFHYVNIDPVLKQKIGAYVLDKLYTLGMIDRRIENKKNKKIIYAYFNSDILDYLVETKEIVEENCPLYLPCIEKPLDWSTSFDGGYHTDELKKKTGQLIDGYYIPKQEDIKIITQAVNGLQSVKFKINNKILETAKNLYKQGIETDEICSHKKKEPPEKPDFFAYKTRKEFNEQELNIFKEWKKETKEFHLKENLEKSKFLNMNMLFKIADLFVEQEKIYFVYKCDFRGRFYPYTIGINPQGSDLQKAVLHFAESKPLKSEEAIRWFFIHGANKYGVDKESYDDRIKWVNDNEKFILSFANDPISNRDWLNADKPFQFLAWCFEFKDYLEQGVLFESHLAISMDGSCNGLQHLSALLLDEVGGKATNLTPSLKPEDIYSTVAKETEKLLDDSDFGIKWKKHGISRKVVKRCVMTMPYGSTRFSCREFILNDYLKVYKPIEFKTEEYSKAAKYLSFVVWEAIKKVVIKGREAMDYLQYCSKEIMNDNKFIEWYTPNGLKIRQDYRELEQSSIYQSELFGGMKILLFSESKKPSKRQHKNGIAPNFIHSLDASHMQRVIVRAKREGINYMAMIHDDFGTHANDCELFAKIIREEFVEMYKEKNWLEEFRMFHVENGIELLPTPEKGNLNITQVIDSKYFFG